MSFHIGYVYWLINSVDVMSFHIGYVYWLIISVDVICLYILGMCIGWSFQWMSYVFSYWVCVFVGHFSGCLMSFHVGYVYWLVISVDVLCLFILGMCIGWSFQWMSYVFSYWVCVLVGHFSGCLMSFHIGYEYWLVISVDVLCLFILGMCIG